MSYIGSFPHGGGKATIEAMGAGMPLIIHSNYRSTFFTDLNEVDRGALAWGSPAALFAMVASLTISDLRRHSAQSRSFYEANHVPSLLKKALEITDGRLQSAPPRPQFAENALQAYLDEWAPKLVHREPADSPPPSKDLPPKKKRKWHRRIRRTNKETAFRRETRDRKAPGVQSHPSPAESDLTHATEALR